MQDLASNRYVALNMVFLLIRSSYTRSIQCMYFHASLYKRSESAEHWVCFSSTVKSVGLISFSFVLDQGHKFSLCGPLTSRLDTQQNLIKTIINVQIVSKWKGYLVFKMFLFRTFYSYSFLLKTHADCNHC